MAIAIVLVLVSGFLELPSFAQSATRSIVGTVAANQGASLTVSVDPGAVQQINIPAGTLVQRIPAGAIDLTQATSMDPSAIKPGDRVLITLQDGTAGARRILVMAASEISQRQQADRQDWDTRGVAGIVKSRSSTELILAARGSGGETRILLSPQVKVRRYRRDSVEFSDADPSASSDIQAGDQVRARGIKDANGILTAEEIVYGSFVTVAGRVTSMDAATQTVTIQAFGSNAPLTLRISARTQIKAMPTLPVADRGAPSQGRIPPTQTMPTSGPPGDINQMLDRLPLGAFGDVQVGQMVIASASRASGDGPTTAFVLIANASFLLTPVNPSQESVLPLATGIETTSLPVGLDLSGMIP